MTRPNQTITVGCRIDHIEQAAAKFKPRIEAFLRALRDAVEAETGATGGEVYELDEEWGWSLSWSVDPGSPTGHGVDVKLFLSDASHYGDAEEEQHGQFVNVMIECVKYGGQIVISYAPYNFTPECWVDLKGEGAVDELSSRLEPIENGLEETVEVVAGAVREELA